MAKDYPRAEINGAMLVLYRLVRGEPTTTSSFTGEDCSDVSLFYNWCKARQNWQEEKAAAEARAQAVEIARAAARAKLTDDECKLLDIK